MTNDVTALRDIARESIAAGALPSRAPLQTWGGRGTGVRCALCRAPVDEHEIEFEVEFEIGADAGRYHLHLACFSAWDAERKALRADPGAAGAERAAPPPAFRTLPSSDKSTVLIDRNADGNIVAHGGERSYKPGAA